MLSQVERCLLIIVKMVQDFYLWVRLDDFKEDLGTIKGLRLAGNTVLLERLCLMRLCKVG